jgi:hypothetical protein
MNPGHVSPGHDTDTERFDAAARQAHAVALDRLSPQVRAQLAQRRRAALAGPRPARARPWGLMAVGSAALLALAIGIFVQRDLMQRAPGGTQVAPADGGLAAAPTTPSPQPAPDNSAPAPATDTPSPVVAHRDAPAADTRPPATEPTTDTVEVDALPDTWLAAEFEDAEAEASFAGLEETPDFYLWLGSDEDLAEFTEFL